MTYQTLLQIKTDVSYIYKYYYLYKFSQGVVKYFLKNKINVEFNKYECITDF